MAPPPPPPPRRRFPRRGPGAAANRCRRPCGGSVVPAAGPGARRPALASPGPSLRRGPAAPERPAGKEAAGGARWRRRRQELMSGGAAPGRAAAHAGLRTAADPGPDPCPDPPRPRDPAHTPTWAPDPPVPRIPPTDPPGPRDPTYRPNWAQGPPPQTRLGPGTPPTDPPGPRTPPTDPPGLRDPQLQTHLGPGTPPHRPACAQGPPPTNPPGSQTQPTDPPGPQTHLCPGTPAYKPTWAWDPSPEIYLCLQTIWKPKTPAIDPPSSPGPWAPDPPCMGTLPTDHLCQQTQLSPGPLSQQTPPKSPWASSVLRPRPLGPLSQQTKAPAHYLGPASRTQATWAPSGGHFPVAHAQGEP
ncbi:proline-rich protein HaeIII subfamily 1-like [Marmota flaviventris]|uniref:proline-rich protein HaeIII subfamily 1-like n=1 Tax=Marmota flaviventris TaxID=93162 RepID=UPI003A8BE0DE